MTDTAHKTWFITGASNGFGREWTESLPRDARSTDSTTSPTDSATQSLHCSSTSQTSARSATP